MHATYDETVNVLGDTTVTVTLHTDQTEPEQLTETGLTFGDDEAIRARITEHLTARSLAPASEWTPTRHPGRTKRRHPILWRADLRPATQP